MKTFAYLRISTNEHNQSNSFDIQLSHIQGKYKVDEVYKDTTSGSTPFFKRTAWSELMSRVSKDDVIIAHRMDRVSRQTMHYLVMESELKKIGVKLLFIDGVNGEDATSTLIKTILSAVSSYEREMIKVRIVQAKAKMKAENKHLGGSVPYGYDKDSDGYLIPNSKEQSVIEVMKDGRDNMNLSYGKLAGYLDDLGHKTRKGTSFTSMTVSRILKYNEESV